MLSKRMATLATSLVALTATPSAYALPDARVTSATLSTVQQGAATDPRLAGATVLQDEKDPVIYVGPATRKTEEGTFAPTPDANQCDVLRSDYDLTYSVPTEPPQQWADVARQGPFSPFFDRGFGIFVRYGTLIQNLLNKQEELSQLRDSHRDIYIAYLTTKETYEHYQAQVDALQYKLDSLDGSVRSAIILLSFASTDADKTAARELLAEAKLRRSLEAPALNSALATQQANAIAARDPYVQAKAAWSPYVANEGSLMDEERQLMDATQAASDLANQAFSVAESTLERDEGRFVGTAAVTFTLFDTELDAARQLLPAGTAFTIKPLDVFDVTLGGSNVHNTLERATVPALAAPGASGNQVFDQFDVTLSGPQGTAGSPTQSPFDMGTGHWLPEGRTIPPNARVTFVSPVTRGAYCMGSRARTERAYTIPNASTQYPSGFTGYAYGARSNNVFADSLAITYRYVERVAPARASCELDFTDTANLVTRMGKIPSLFFERRWDDTTRAAVKANGFWCDVTLTASDPNDPAAPARLEDLRQSLIQDTLAEFVITYGKQWKITAYSDETVTASDRDASLARMRPSKRDLCGELQNCQVTGLVFPSLDELFAASSAGSGRRTDFNGHVVRDGALHTTRVVMDRSASVDLVVRAP